MIGKGFVIAMKGKVVLRRDNPRKRRFLAKAWFLVSRSGAEGQLLLVGWMGREAESASAHSAPRLTLAGQHSALHSDSTACFDLLPEMPAGISIAGRMIAAAGRAWLWKEHSRYALRIVGRLPGGLSCRIAVMQCPWIGEVFDGDL